MKISFEDHPISSANSNPATDQVQLFVDVTFAQAVGGGGIVAALTFCGTQDAINSIGDANPYVFDGAIGDDTVNTSQGPVTVKKGYASPIDPCEIVSLGVRMLDSEGWGCTGEVCRQTNLILCDGQAIVDSDGTPLVHIL